MVLFAIGATIAQRTITGTVTDQSGAPLIGASVLVKGTTIGTITDVDGQYSLSIPETANTLVFSYTGYQAQERQIGPSDIIDVTMQEGVVLQEAVVTALGVRRDEKALGFAVQQVDGQELEETRAISVIDALSGKAAGVQVTQASGAAGAGSRLIVRGQTSFNGNNEALMIVDGIRIDNSEFNSENGTFGVANSNRGIDLNPSDIESISVLKGAAATALYGVEGARGVILITTKKGAAKEGIGVDFSTNYMLSEFNKMPEIQKSYSQGGAGIWTGPDGSNPWWGGFGRALSWGARIDTLAWDGSDYRYDKNGRIVSQNDPNAQRPVVPYDNIDNFFGTGQTWQSNLALTGGNEDINYRFSFGYTDQTGITPKNQFERANVGLAVTSKLFDDKLSISSSLNYVNSGGIRIQQGSNTSGVMLGLVRTPPTFDNANGFGEDAADNPSAYVFPDNTQRNYRGGPGYDNPYWVTNLTPFTDRVNRFFGSLKLAYEFDNWAILSTTLGTDFYSDNRKQEFELRSNTFPGGQVFEDQYNYRHTDIYVNLLGNGNLNSTFTLNYNLGINLWNQFLKQNYVQGDGLNFFGFRELANTQSVITTVNHTPERSFSAFGSVDVGFKNFLYLTLTGRNDWLSTLIVPGKEFDAGDISVFYPSASLSFVFSEVLNSDFLSFGKARLSYAQVGGGAPNPFLTGTPYQVPNNTTTIFSLNDGWTNGILFPFQGTSGYTFSPLQGNISLVPSRTTDYEAGVDLRFFNNRIGIDATYYQRRSTDQIIAINVPNSTGFQRAVINSGELRTNGGEVVLNISPIRKPEFSWNMNFNFSKWRSVVEALPPGVPNQFLQGFTGTAIYNIAPLADGTKFEYGQIFGGAFQRVNDEGSNGEPIFNPNNPYNPNGALIIDDSGSPDPDADDYNGNYGFPLADPVNRVIGNPNPDFLLGINNSFRWKDLSFSFLFDIKQGGEMWNGTLGAMTFFGTSANTEDRVPLVWNDNQGFVHDYSNPNYQFDGVKASSGEGNDIQVPLDENWYTGNGGGFGSVAEHFVEDASFYRLRYASISYNLGRLINGVSDLTLTLTGRNLLLFTPYNGIDPETSLVGPSSNGQGLDYFQLPGTRSYSFGVNVKF